MSAQIVPGGLAARAGIGLRAPHVADALASPPPVGWYEVHIENYLGGGVPLRQLESARRDRPVALHGVGSSLAGAEPPDPRHLARIRALARAIEPAIVSEHLAWSVSSGVYLNDLLPVPYTEEALELCARNVWIFQENLGRPILLENPSTYLRYVDSAIPEGEFLAALARRTGCGILLDVNNLYVSYRNTGAEPEAVLTALAGTNVGEIHVAGHAVNDADGHAALIDDHGSEVAAEVWQLYARAVRLFPNAATLVEWDTNLPSLTALAAEARRADRRRSLALNGEDRDALS
ncbi:MAG: DUF692 domain-containing protein [Rhodospirillales bacterium]|nr:DUF692 domain-containing protein [Rhodospirillales bacterium]